MSTVTRSGGGPRRSVERPRWVDPAYLALALADVVRWLGWCLMKALVGWGAFVCGDPRLADGWRADLGTPRPLRHEVVLRREVARGIARLEDHLAVSRSAGSRPADGTSDRTGS